MLHEVEREYKFIVTKEKLLETQQAFSKFTMKRKCKTQINYYYDTCSNFYNSIGETIRIRQIENSLELQIKKHRMENSYEYSTSDEITENIQTVLYRLKPYSLDFEVFLKGVLVTNRCEMCFGVNSTICFDTNLYLGSCDYEIELEFSKQDECLVTELVSELGLLDKSFANKSSRFFMRLNEIMNTDGE